MCNGGVWANDHVSGASGAFLYRKADGRILLKRQKLGDLPRPGEVIKPEIQRLSFNDLIEPTEIILRKTMEDLLDRIVISDSNVTRREEQLDQLCNLLLLKLESDKHAQGRSAGRNISRGAWWGTLRGLRAQRAAQGRHQPS
jgi:type I restriction enzyme M protein